MQRRSRNEHFDQEKRAQKKKERQRYKTYRDKDAQRRRIEIILSIIGLLPKLPCREQRLTEVGYRCYCTPAGGCEWDLGNEPGRLA